VSPRVRSGLFGAGALVCGLLSAALAGGAAAPAGEGLGELRSVVVTAAPLERGASLDRTVTDKALEERRVPVAFAPPDALSIPAEALGRRLAVPLPAGSYLTTASLVAGSPQRSRRTGPPRGTTPVEITVTGAGALEASRTEVGAAVDVVVSGEPGPGPAVGRTHIAAESVPLLALRKAPAETGLGADRWIATLALTREEALRLIRADSAAASIRLLAH
jgi:Flp pilus assembly protein CpaB